VLAAFQNVANTLASLEADSETLAFADAASRAARDASSDAAARVRLGALPPRSARGAEQQFLNARLTAIRASSARMSDTAALFQAMGSPLADSGIAQAQ
jgi:outer membrane protein TolC